MNRYAAPQKEIRFVLEDLLGFDAHYSGLPSGVSLDLVEAVVEGASRFSERELAPLRSTGDREGCRLLDGSVIAPTGFKEAYRKYAEDGWPSLNGHAAFGGQGLPPSVGTIVAEIMSGANLAWAMYPGLSQGSIAVIARHGSSAQKAEYLAKLISGEWTGTMCLTEPHAGSDLGLLSTKAVPNADGSYRIEGTKIFISAGDHDLAENIVHLVLARVPGAPRGTRGISLFIVPKYLNGRRNNVLCTSLEDKMGIHAASTCTLSFDGARGFLVGAENAGLRCMFTMMNSARLGVGVQSVGLMEAGYQDSLRYAQERRQMRSLAGPSDPNHPADRIIMHADVRRMLLTQRAFVEGSRALIYFLAQLLDVSNDSSEAGQQAGRLLDLMTPIAKGFVTEIGFESVNLALQVFGGHGYIRENGMEQLVRDARITMLYEGTTQIQALDLLGRKVVASRSDGLSELLMLLRREAAVSEFPQLGVYAELWQDLSSRVGELSVENLHEIGAASVDYLMFAGYVSLAYFWSRMARAAEQNDEFSRGKRATAEFYFKRLMPRAEAHRQAIFAGAETLMRIQPAEFAESRG
ncbi:MAG: acyl-CoA dehydrogenase C-terminal domain-containing protein [Pseudomonadales bacterium]